ncbi:hypothetical protein SAMD00023353_0403510 [Rosellinia necatrix]|uniref:Uncharacterized protein n=1 Tax=Rosellinia necatrix TaxID=77044 RepID=A0A1S8A5D6_ROSNE|nr:hypothetical protein SAMD00023353_0403510 [Rosellinia necatrix]
MIKYCWLVVAGCWLLALLVAAAGPVVVMYGFSWRGWIRNGAQAAWVVLHAMPSEQKAWQRKKKRSPRPG